jgi:uncharacterized membrane protein YoaK (UPF0700 family)
VATSNGVPQTNLTHENIANGEARLLLALQVMTTVTGIVDAVSYLGLGHVFTANMTGNVVLLGLALAGAPQLSIARPLISLLAFMAGGVVGGRLSLAQSAASRGRQVLTAAAFEAGLLCAGALVCARSQIVADDSGIRIYLVIVLTAAAMGFRTATVHRLGVTDITTTVVTSILAGLAADSSLAGGHNLRIGRRVWSALLVLSGAAVGVLLLRFGLAVPLICGGLLTLAAASVYARACSDSSSVGEERA